MKIPEPREEKSGNGSGADKLVPLLEERARTKELLALIENKRGEVAEEVYLRVKIDYELRLGNLNREIKRQARNFENTLEDYRDLVGRLEASDKVGVRSLEELKVRYALGEYSEEEYKKIAAGKKEKIDFYRSKIKSYKMNMERLDSVLAQLENG
ncbi:MAG: hypothetical protein A3F83_02540 [Candidatus Glassbacteria bacterium RIFCSPLOWO2_12_FULL_58_11]|uniref:Uncharacterized protein n=1 Tax=Candidatus Glassbacteria bacterium RIFCSPLOWO2_12_FULL_58_11 TaxID=1817867 RepID=A0A1F5YSW4_9BACT|nr:MAG: hypothetical protein A3F83_02540 [Candidatus Glassbacteria bacterium RIFCSPLOWO2_12_FULL_58_11]